MQDYGPDLFRVQMSFINAYLIGTAESWVLLDCGLPGNRTRLWNEARDRFGQNVGAPRAIVLTHGHTDHAGSAASLADLWDVPIYAHPLELPYLTGRSNYPPFDPTVGGPLAFGVRFTPRTPVNLGLRVRPLLADGSLPGLPDWRWLATPGHSPGHISLVHPASHRVVVGDAAATLDADSWPGLLFPAPLCPTARSITCDWPAALASLQTLLELEPTLLACGHGTPLQGPAASSELRKLAERLTPPSRGRYARQPAITDLDGVVSLPPAPPDQLPGRIGWAAAAVGLAIAALRRKRPMIRPISI